MGWDPGSGLGPNGSGITTPVIAFKRPRKRGLGMDVNSVGSNSGNCSDTTNSSSQNIFVPASNFDT